jgi:hypothetical protein
MKIARYRIGEQVSYGIVEGDTVRDITASPFEDYQITDRTHPLSQVKLLPPTTPRNLLTTGGQYREPLDVGAEPGQPPQGRQHQPLS